MVTLVYLRQSTRRVSFMGWLGNNTFIFVSGLNAWWIVVFGVEHEEYLEVVDLTSYVGTVPTWLASYFSLCDLPLLFFYFQVNAGVLYFLDYVEDLYIRVLSVLVSILDPNHVVFTSSNKLYQYTTIRASLFPFQSLNQNHT